MDDERTPDHSEDPRKQGTGQGYPESNPGEATPADGTEEGPEAKAGGAEAPWTATERESDRGQTTGNPHAAG